MAAKARTTSLLDRIPLWVMSSVVMAASCFLDGAYISRYAYQNMGAASVLGIVLSYALNAVCDLAVGRISGEFVRQQTRKHAPRRWVRLAIWSLPVFWILAFVYTAVFSFREASLIQPKEPLFFRVSIATFAPVLLTGLNVCQALRDGGIDEVPVAESSTAKPRKKPRKKPRSQPEVLPGADPVDAPQPIDQGEQEQEEKVPALSVDERRDAIVLYLQRHPKARQVQVAAAYGVSRATAGKDLRFLQRQGRVLALSGGGWAMVEPVSSGDNGDGRVPVQE